MSSSSRRTTTWPASRSSTTKISRSSATSTRKKRISTTKSPDALRPRFALGLGANLGSPRRTFAAALEQLRDRLGPLVVAPLYRTGPISPIPQPDYLNTVAVGTVPEGLEPAAVLAFTQQLEREAGREAAAPRWGPRPLDIDLLVWGKAELATPTLSIPHPRLRERRFVLAPLADVAPELPVPPDGATVMELLARLEDSSRVERVPWEDPP